MIPLLASIAAKVTVTLALGLLAARLARGRRAAVRHALLATSLAMLLAIPIVATFAPRLPIALTAAPPTAAPLAAVFIAPASLPAPAAPQPGIAPETVVLGIWLAGAAVFLAPVLVGFTQVRRLRRFALPRPDSQALLDALAPAAAVRRPVQVLLHPNVPGPMTCGVANPAIVLPLAAQSWPSADLHRALVHELEHVRRGDWIIHCFARVLCAVYWFHPLVWMAWRQLVLEAERACDDAVLGHSEPTAYADQLLEIARGFAGGSKPPLLAMANRSDLATRVHAVLDLRQPRGRAGKGTVVLAAAAAILLTLGLSPLAIVAAPQSPAPRFHAESNLVLTTVVVTDKNDNPVPGLTASDFDLTDDGAPQKITYFEFRDGLYVLGYYAGNGNSKPGSFHRIEVTGKSANMDRMKFRMGYMDKSPAPVPVAAAPKAIVGNNGPLVGQSSQTVAVAPTAVPGSKPPILLSKREPEYSEEARKAKYQGTVILSVEVDTDGVPQNIRVIRSIGLGLDEKAIEAVQRWKFKPGTQDGNPISMRTEVEVQFRLL